MTTEEQSREVIRRLAAGEDVEWQAKVEGIWQEDIGLRRACHLYLLDREIRLTDIPKKYTAHMNCAKCGRLFTGMGSPIATSCHYCQPTKNIYQEAFEQGKKVQFTNNHDVWVDWEPMSLVYPSIVHPCRQWRILEEEPHLEWKEKFDRGMKLEIRIKGGNQEFQPVGYWPINGWPENYEFREAKTKKVVPLGQEDFKPGDQLRNKDDFLTVMDVCEEKLHGWLLYDKMPTVSRFYISYSDLIGNKWKRLVNGQWVPCEKEVEA